MTYNEKSGAGRASTARFMICTAVLLAMASPALTRANADAPIATPAPTSSQPYLTMAPLRDYLIPSQSEEVALARSAAPPSISGDADILVLTAHGHYRAVEGKNGWTCMVQRSWNDALDKADFWSGLMAPRDGPPGSSSPHS